MAFNETQMIALGGVRVPCTHKRCQCRDVLHRISDRDEVWQMPDAAAVVAAIRPAT